MHVHICGPDGQTNCCRAYKLWLTIRDLPAESAEDERRDWLLRARLDFLEGYLDLEAREAAAERPV